MKRLKKASSVGWLASFCDDLWTIILDQLPTLDKGMPDLGLMLRLMCTSKRMCALLKPRTIALLNGFLVFIKDRPSVNCPGIYSGDSALFAPCVLFLRGSTRLRDYIETCINIDVYHTAQYLSNSLSLLHLAYLEGRYLYSRDACYKKDAYCWCGHARKSPSDLCISRYDPLKEIMYFNPKSRKVVRLHLAKTEVASVKPPLFSFHERALGSLREKKKDETAFLSLSYDSEEARVAAVDILRENGALTTVAAKGDNVFDELVVKEYHIYSEHAKSFRERCFISNGCTVKHATYMYLLHTYHERNMGIFDELCLSLYPTK